MMRIRLACVILACLALPATAAARSTKIAPLTAEGLPNVQSHAALVVDLDSGAQIYGKNIDAVRPIASTGKIFVALVARKRGIDLEALTEITKTDAALAKGGSRTRLAVGHKFRNIDLLRAMLVASDNRAPSALGRAVGLDKDALISEMNQIAQELGLQRTHFTDTCGLNGNESTAREMALALAATMRDPVLAEVMTTRSVEIVSVHAKPHRIGYRNTNRLLHNQANQVLGGKTGFTTAAGYCLVVGANVAGRNCAMVFLGSQGKLTRFGDFSRVQGWMNTTLGTQVASK
jgi:D-alanyl-D-alanine endopeptidase (penicillin-binding protein 7)